MNSPIAGRLARFKQFRMDLAGAERSLFGWTVFRHLAVILLLFPIIFTGLPGTLPHCGLPRVLSGDEPHYLIMINSLASDGDLNLANNYESVHRGGIDAGRVASDLRTLEHHTRYALPDGPRNWWEIYELSAVSSEGALDANANNVARLKVGQSAPAATTAQYSTHQPGLALLFAPALFPLRNSDWLEPMAILFSTGAVIGAFFYFRQITRHFQAEEAAINLVSGLAFLGTTVWFYAHSLFPEGLLLLCVCGAYSLGLTRGSACLAGVFMGAAIQIKAYYLLFALPLGIDYLINRSWRQTFLFSVPIVVSGALFLLQNQLFFGDWRNSAQDFIVGSFSEGALGLLFSLKWGLFFFSPVIVFALAYWPRFVRAYPREGALLASAFVLNFVLISYYQVWFGGNCVGPRYLVPFVPFLFVPLAVKAYSPWQWRPLAKWAFAFLAMLSIYANADAAFRRARYWDSNPLVHIGKAAMRKVDKLVLSKA